MRIARQFMAASLIVFVAGWTAPAFAEDSSAAAQPATPKTGEYESTVAAGAPNTSPSELDRRFGLKPNTTPISYDPSGVQLRVYVPAEYAPASPMGLLVFLNNQDTEPPPVELQSLLDAAHLIFVAPHSNSAHGTDRAALVLDIAADFQKRYAIDKSRIYLMESEDSDFMAFTVMDVFTGYISLEKLVLYERFTFRTKAGTTSITPHDTAPPSAAVLSIAKKRPFVSLVSSTAGADPMVQTIRLAEVNEMRREGYAHVESVRVGDGQEKYPQFAATWFRQTTRFLDAANVSKSRGAITARSDSPTDTTRPSTGATAEQQADRLLKLGKLYLDAGRKDAARAKFKELIQEYPTAPAAATARKVLATLDEK